MVLNKLKSNDFKSLRENGKTFKTPNFLFVYNISKEGSEPEQINYGFTITKKVGKAFLRNRLRRLLRESLRLYIATMKAKPLPSDKQIQLYLNIVVLQKKPESILHSNVNEQVQHFFNTRIYT